MSVTTCSLIGPILFGSVVELEHREQRYPDNPFDRC
jgi:hypothetical protein